MAMVGFGSNARSAVGLRSASMVGSDLTARSVKP
eukprot:GSChrysophyteH2.ASY1.ANO1.899.1 assembled CDS